MGKTTPRERRHQRTREAILKAAIDLIRDKGADNLSLRAIAREIDYSPAGLYEYFGSKEEIIDAVCTQANDYLRRYLQAVDNAMPLADYLLELGLAYVKFACENPEMFTLMFNSLDGPSEGITVNDLDESDSFTILAKVIKSGIESGQIHVDNNLSPIEISYSLWALVHGMAVLQVTYLHNFPLDFERANHFTLRTFINGLIAR